MRITDITKSTKLLPCFLSLSLLFPNIVNAQFPISWTRINEQHRIVTVDNRKFKASLVRTKKKPYKIAWHAINQRRDVVGDEKHELSLHNKIAKAATISRYVSRSNNLDGVLGSHIKNFRKFLYAASIVEVSKFVRDVGSKLEGKLIRMSLTGYNEVDTTKIISSEMKKELFKRFDSDDSRINSIEDLAKKLKSNYNLTSLIGIAKSLYKLEKARIILKNTSTWSYRNASIFYELYKSGLLEGLAYQKFWTIINIMKNLGWKKQAKIIVNNFGEGLIGIKFSELFNKSNKNRDIGVFVGKQKESSMFTPIDRLYSSEKCSDNDSFIHDFLYPHNNDRKNRKRFENILKLSSRSLNNPLIYTNLDCYTDQEVITVTQAEFPSAIKIKDSVMIAAILKIFKISDDRSHEMFNRAVDKIFMYKNNIRKMGTKISLYDLTGDKIPEIIVESESQGNIGIQDYSVIGIKENEFDFLLNVKNIAQGELIIKEGNLIISKSYPRWRDPNCCPSRDKLTQYKWNGKKFDSRSWVVEK
jgi:hypothetical protein